MLFTVDRNCYLVAYQELLTIKGETGCVPEKKKKEKLVAYQKKRNWLRTRRRETGCVPEKRKRETGRVPEKEKLVAYQKKRNWLRTRRRETGCVPGKEILVAYQELANKQLLTSKGYQVDN